MKILVIRFMAIGDVVLSSTLCSSLKKSFPDAEVHYLMHSTSADLFLHHPHIDKVISLTPDKRKNPLKYFNFIRNVASAKYDIIVDATSTAKSEFISMLSRGSEFRIGRLKKKRGFFFTHKIASGSEQVNKIEQRMQMLKPLQEAGLAIRYEKQVVLAISAQEKADMEKVMKLHGVDFSRPIFTFAVSSKEHGKKWHRDSLVALGRYCLDRYGAQIILFAGMPHEQPDVDYFYQQLDRHPDVYTEVPSPSLRKLCALLQHSHLFLGNEGGPRHLADAMGIPTVSVFSPSSRRAEWLPLQNDRHLAVEWQDIDPDLAAQSPHFEYANERYFQLYQKIEAKHVISLVDQVIVKHVEVCHTNGLN